MTKIKNRHMEAGFIYFARTANVASDIKIDSVSVKSDYITASFTRAISPEIGSFKIVLINSDGRFSDKYGGGETVQLYADLESGTTLVFEGKIDSIKSNRQSFETLEVSGGHLSSELLDVTVTKEYDNGLTCDEILKEIIGDYLTGYTTTNIATSTVSPNIKWSNKPFWNCVEDLCKLAVASGEVTTSLKRFDCYVDDDKDFHFFKENSVLNSTDSIVWNDTMLTLSGYGESSVLSKNKIITYGDAGGLTIIREAEDAASQNLYGLKESVITDTDIITESIADDITAASLTLNKTPETEGKAQAFLLPSIRPGEKIWVSDPTLKITQKIKMSKYTHTFPNERTSVILTKDRNLPTLFRERMLKDMAQDEITNPFEMTKSINYTFDNYNRLSAWDNNISITESIIKISSGTTGTIVSDTFTQTKNITQVQLLVIGEKLADNVVYKLSTNGGEDFQAINPDVLSNVTSGRNLVLQVDINSTDAQIDTLALLMK